MLGIMNSVIQTASRTTRPESAHDREARIRREQNRAQADLHDDHARRAQLGRGYW